MKTNRQPHWPQAVIMGTGLVLIVMGIVAIGAQLFVEVQQSGMYRASSRSIEVTTTSAKLSTTFVGLPLVLLGSILEVVGYLAGRPWGESQAKDSN